MQFRHYKGGIYTVLHFGAIYEDDGEPAVIYQSNRDGQVWVRRYNSFFEYLDNVKTTSDVDGPRYTGPRFVSVEQDRHACKPPSPEELAKYFRST